MSVRSETTGDKPPRRRPTRGASKAKTTGQAVPKVKAEQGSAVPQPARSPRAGSEGKPKYEQLLRSEARLWPDQVEYLTRKRREIMSDRVDKSERITDNTLLRVAVDLLMAAGDRLQGDTEAELVASVTKLVDEANAARQAAQSED